MGCHYLAWLAAILVSLDSATQDQFLLSEFLAFHKAQPSRDILRINFAVLVKTVHVALLPDNVLNGSGFFSQDSAENPPFPDSFLGPHGLIWCTQFLTLYFLL